MGKFTNNWFGSHRVLLPAYPMRKFIASLFLVLTSVSATAASAPQWIEVRSPHFVVITDTNEKQARKIAGQFERMRSLFQLALPHAAGDAGLPITVLALKDKKGFQALEPAAYLAKSQLQLAGLFLRTPDRNYILLRLDAEYEHPFAVVYHEYTHFILRKAEGLPLWLNEGLAEFYQNTDIDEKSVRLGQSSVDNILYLRQSRLLPLATLLAVDHNSPYYHDEQKGSVFYAESWALAHFIEVTDFQNKTNHLGDYTHRLSLHEDPVLAARHTFGDLGELQKALEKYVSQNKYQQFNVNMAFTADEASFAARPLPVADADAVRADVLANNDRRPEAQALLDAILRNDPKNALAHETMGALAWRDNNSAQAKKWYGEAVKLDSQSYVAYFNYASYSMADGDTSNDETIESSLRTAIKLEPSFAPSYDALAQFYASRHKNFEEAHLLSVQAVQLEPGEMRYRINASQVAMEQKNIDGALAILRTALTLSKTDADGAMLLQRIQQIQEYKDHMDEFAARSASSSETSVEMHLPGRSSGPSEPEPTPFPEGPVLGAHHKARGVLHAVRCGYPTVLTLEVEQAGKAIALYTNNYYKIPFTTANFILTDDIDPCKAIEGMKASVEYTDVTNKLVAGKIVSIELSK